MQNILAALLGGAGAGLQSYGQSAFRQQEAQQAQRQRMAELEQQEQMRRTLLQEAQQARQQEREQVNADMTAAMTAMGLPVPKGVTLTPQTTPMVTQQQMAQREQDRVRRERLGTYNALKQRGVPVGDAFDPDTDYGTVFKDYGREDGQANSRAMQSTALAARAAADAARAAAQAAGRQTQQGTTQNRTLMQLGKEYETVAEKRRSLYGVVENGVLAADQAAKGDGTAQATLLYSFITSLDPESTVREGELDLMKSARPLWDSAKAQYARIMQGQAALVTPQQAQAMKTLMEERMRRQAGRDMKFREEYLRKGTTLGLPQEEVGAYLSDFIPQSFRPQAPGRVNLNRY